MILKTQMQVHVHGFLKCFSLECKFFLCFFFFFFVVFCFSVVVFICCCTCSCNVFAVVFSFANFPWNTVLNFVKQL